MISNCIKGRQLRSQSLHPRVSSWQAGLASHHRLNLRVAHHQFAVVKRWANNPDLPKIILPDAGRLVSHGAGLCKDTFDDRLQLLVI